MKGNVRRGWILLAAALALIFVAGAFAVAGGYINGNEQAAIDIAEKMTQLAVIVSVVCSLCAFFNYFVAVYQIAKSHYRRDAA